MSAIFIAGATVVGLLGCRLDKVCTQCIHVSLHSVVL